MSGPGVYLLMGHVRAQGEEFGFPVDNFLGLSRVSNPRTTSWPQFMRARMLEQLQRLQRGTYAHAYECWLLVRRVRHHTCTHPNATQMHTRTLTFFFTFGIFFFWWPRVRTPCALTCGIVNMQVVELLPQVFEGVRHVVPCLLHGDVGPFQNWSVDRSGDIVVRFQ